MNRKNKGLLAVLLLGLLLSGGLTGCGEAGQKTENLKESGQNQEENGRMEAEEVRKADAEQEMEADSETEAEPAGEADSDSDDLADEEPKTEQPLAGKKLTVCGDSISTFTGYIPDYYSKYYPEMGEITDVKDTWWMQVLERTGMELCRNASYSGSTVSGLSLDEEDGRYACGNRRVADLCGESGEEPDIILILMGTNDLLTDVPLGSYDGVSAVGEGNIGTFSEAYALMLDKMIHRYPEADIYCCTIAEVGRQNEEGESYAYSNIHNAQARDYNAWIEAVAKAKGIPVIDVYGCGITSGNIMEYTTEGTHPNAAGARLIADKVCEELGAGQQAWR